MIILKLEQVVSSISKITLQNGNQGVLFKGIVSLTKSLIKDLSSSTHKFKCANIVAENV